jgi:hypothetical protein
VAAAEQYAGEEGGLSRGKQPKLRPNQAELAELFGVGRSTVYRTIERMRPKPPEPERPFAHLAHPQR